MERTCKKCGNNFKPKKGLKNYCSLSCRNSRGSRSKKFKRHLSKMMKDRGVHPSTCGTYVSGSSHPNWVERVKSKCNECDSIFEHKKTIPRKYCSSKCSLLNFGGYNKNSTRKNSSTYKGFNMDSGAEREFAKLLDENSIKWIKNTTEYFLYEDLEGFERKYYPDFYLPDKDWWVEIKGKFWEDELVKLKMQALENIEIIYSDNIRLPNYSYNYSELYSL